MRPRTPLNPLAELRDRVLTASKTQLLLDVVNLFALMFLAYFTYYLGMKPADQAVSRIFYWAYVLGLVYSVTYKYLLKELVRNEKWEHEYVKRKRLISDATNKLVDLYHYDDRYATRLDRIERSILEAVKSYSEKEIFDTQGLRLSVTLIVEDWNEDEKGFFVCLNRAASDRPVARYPKSELELALLAWEQTCLKYEPNVPRNTARKAVPYKTVFILPIAHYQPSGPQKRDTIGLLSIDSTREDQFSARVRARIEMGLLPYIALLRASLFLRQRYSLWPELNRTID